MPQRGVSVSEGTITRWAKQVGDTVEADETLLEISTDKVDTEVPSPGSGVVSEILVQEGETVAVGTVLARIGGEAGGCGAPPPAARCCTGGGTGSRTSSGDAAGSCRGHGPGGREPGADDRDETRDRRPHAP